MVVNVKTSLVARGPGLRARQPGGGWAPTGGPAGPVVRLRASDLALANGAAVAAWGSTAQADPALQPVFDATGFGGSPTVHFNSGDTLFGIVPLMDSGANSYSMLAVVRPAALGARMGIVFAGTGTTGEWLTIEAGAKVGERSGGVALVGQSTGLVVLDTPAVIGCIHDVVLGEDRMFLNGPDGVITGTAGHWYGGGTTFQLGARGAGDPYIGDLSEVAYWQRPLTAEEMTTEVAALVAAYSIGA